MLLAGAEADVTIEVRNSGPTIQTEILGQIFDPLKTGTWRGGSDDSEKGLGLGLYIVRQIAQAHGGEVNVQSSNGETVFAVRLPRGN